MSKEVLFSSGRIITTAVIAYLLSSSCHFARRKIDYTESNRMLEFYSSNFSSEKVNYVCFFKHVSSFLNVFWSISGLKILFKIFLHFTTVIEVVAVFVLCSLIYNA